jgi:chlorite dismutase
MIPIQAAEGRFVSHLFWNIDRNLWASLDPQQRSGAQRRFSTCLEEYRSSDNHQAFCYAIWGLKADLGVLLVDPDLNHLNETEHLLAASFPAGALEPAYSFASMSESSEYVSQDNDYDRSLRAKGLDPDSEEYQAKMGEFRTRMQAYINERLYPQLPAHRVMCFYPMNKARGEVQNWYLLDFETRKNYMASHSITGRKYGGDVKQLVTGSVGLDDWEWGVTLFADDPFFFKKIVYEMRYDEASARFGEFGEFLIGINLEPEELWKRLQL